ncbi:uncharacterized protein M6B38_405200 [Iris pallida]|uniref:DCD domain-containing protein n=1 Tax=Iris pallida TaxID=29817 RepID=A0AAX6FPU0_IRIPA|nr:uncharacterized protein M6B38_405200 [Iris pallida]
MVKTRKNKDKARATAEAAGPAEAAAAAPALTSNSTPVSAKKKIRKKQRNKSKIPEAKIAAAEQKEPRAAEEERKETAAAKEDRKEPTTAGKEEKSSGFIFMCNSRTKPECYRNQVFGLPRGKEEMLERIKPGARLFLYDFDVKLLYGIYRATTQGGLNLVPEAFRGAFPCQVKFKIDKDCLPLPESSFKQAILENYDSKNKFKPDLSSKQVRKLLSMFQPISSAPQAAGHQYIEDKRHPAHLPPPADPYRQGVYQAPAHLPPPEDLYRSRVHLAQAHMPPPEEPYRSRVHLVPRIPPPEDPYRSRGHYAPAHMPPLEDPYRPAGHMLPPEDPYRSRAYQAPADMPPPEDSYRPGGHMVPSHLPPANDMYRSGRYLVHPQLPPEDPYSLRYVGPTPLESRYLSQLAPPPAGDPYVPQYVGATSTGPPTTDPYYTAPASVPYSQLDFARYQPENPAPSDRLAYRVAHEITRADDPYRTAAIPAVTTEGQPLQSYYLTAYEDPNRPYAESIQRQPPSNATASANASVSSLYAFAGPAPAYR